jgi:hypothetical protein
MALLHLILHGQQSINAKPNPATFVWISKYPRRKSWSIRERGVHRKTNATGERGKTHLRLVQNAQLLDARWLTRGPSNDAEVARDDPASLLMLISDRYRPMLERTLGRWMTGVRLRWTGKVLGKGQVGKLAREEASRDEKGVGRSRNGT